MPHSSDRAQAEPFAALVAVAAVGLGLTLYAGVLDATLPDAPDRQIGDAALERIESDVAPAGVALPALVEDSHRAGPSGYETNVTLRAAGQRWTAGPPAPDTADEATARLGVRISPATVRAGSLRVRVWT